MKFLEIKLPINLKIRSLRNCKFLYNMKDVDELSAIYVFLYCLQVRLLVLLGLLLVMWIYCVFLYWFNIVTRWSWKFILSLQDGRKVIVGDCALFKPPHDSPPFIGIIRRLTLSKDNNLQLGVNWLYRPAELKLSKGILPEAAPNEIFYSFHRDEIPAASLLHPCKVAFLSKGAELPTGISSFICRRVYDISNKCLWWLTDQDYIKVGYYRLIALYSFC